MSAEIERAEKAEAAYGLMHIQFTAQQKRAERAEAASERLSTLGQEWQARARVAEAKVARVEALADEWEQKADVIAITYQDPDRRRMATLGQRVNIRQLRAALADEVTP